MSNKTHYNPLIWVTATAAARNLRLTFNNGNVKIFDYKPLIKRYKFFKPLKTNQFLKTFHSMVGL